MLYMSPSNVTSSPTTTRSFGTTKKKKANTEESSSSFLAHSYKDFEVTLSDQWRDLKEIIKAAPPQVFSGGHYDTPTQNYSKRSQRRREEKHKNKLASSSWRAKAFEEVTDLVDQSLPAGHYYNSKNNNNDLDILAETNQVEAKAAKSGDFLTRHFNEEEKEEPAAVVVVPSIQTSSSVASTSKPQEETKTKEPQDYDDALQLAATGAKTFLQALGFVAKKSFAFVESLKDESHAVDKEALSKISKSGQGVLKLGLGLVQDSLELTAAVTKKEGKKISRSVTYTIGAYNDEHHQKHHHKQKQQQHSVGGSAAAMAKPLSVQYRKTLSLSPPEAAKVWGYDITNGQQAVTYPHHSETKADKKWQQLKSQAEKWMGGLLHAHENAATTYTEEKKANIQAKIDAVVARATVNLLLTTENKVKEVYYLADNPTERKLAETSHKEEAAPAADIISTVKKNLFFLTEGHNEKGAPVVNGKNNHSQQKEPSDSKEVRAESSKASFFFAK